MRQPRASSEGRALPGEGAREAPRGWPDPLAQVDACSPPAFTPLPFLLLPGALGCAHRPAEATGGMSPRKGGASQDSGVLPAFLPAGYGGLGRGPPGVPPTRSSSSRPAGWPAAEAPTLDPRSPGRGRGRFVWAQGASAKPTEPRKITDHRSPRASTPHPEAQPQPLPLGRRFTTSLKTPLSVSKAPGLPRDAHPFTPAPSPPESFSDNRARLKVQATPSQC